MTPPDRPTVAVLGAGQLGRMLAIAGHRLGVHVRCLDPNPDACAGQLTEHIQGEYTDHTALAKLIDGAQVVTYEFENVPVQAARWCAERLPTHPTVDALAAAQDRMDEKSLLQAHGLNVGPHRLVETEDDLRAAAADPQSQGSRWHGSPSRVPDGSPSPDSPQPPGGIGLPAVLKTCRGGYDGKGQAVIRTESDLSSAWADFTTGGTALRAVSPPQSKSPRLILESFINFDREISLLAVRSIAGDVRFYDPVQNHHQGGILIRSHPAIDTPEPGLTQAQAAITNLMTTLDYVGVLAVELFECAPGPESNTPILLASEMAPRVHNSGHWTIDAAACDQFENHLRAILGHPLGSTQTLCPWTMHNCLGNLPPMSDLEEGARLHAYAKAAKPGRKVGHVTVVGG